MNCEELRDFVDVYVDDEFDEDDRVMFAEHLQECERCRGIIHFRRRLRQRLQASFESLEAPGQLRRRIKEALASEPESEPSDPRRWLWMLLPAAAAAVLLLGVGVSRRLDLADLAEQSVQWHRTSLPMDVHSGSAESVRRFLSDKVPFAVRLPRLRAADAQLEGARLSSLAGRRAAYLRYRVRGEPVSVFIVDPRVFRPLAADQDDGDRRVYWHGVKGYNVAVYSNEGMRYAVTSGMDRNRLIELIGHGAIHGGR